MGRDNGGCLGPRTTRNAPHASTMPARRHMSDAATEGDRDGEGSAVEGRAHSLAPAAPPDLGVGVGCGVGCEGWV